MVEYKNHIKFYKDYWYRYFSKFVTASSWGNEELAKSFLEKYWLSEVEYQTVWNPIQKLIFSDTYLSHQEIFIEGFETFKINGGCLFAKKDFEQLQQSLLLLNEKYFVVIQKPSTKEPLFRFKFPVSITWEELESGNYISAVLLEMTENEYFVFGAGDKWGKYTASDQETPFDLIGFNPKFATIFKNKFSH